MKACRIAADSFVPSCQIRPVSTAKLLIHPDRLILGGCMLLAVGAGDDDAHSTVLEGDDDTRGVFVAIQPADATMQPHRSNNWSMVCCF